jgi:hypothetical protein
MLPCLNHILAELTMEPQHIEYGSNSIGNYAWKVKCDNTHESSPIEIFSCTKP